MSNDFPQDFFQDDLVSITGGPLRPHEYVQVLAEMTAADEQWIQNHSARVSGNDPRNPQVTLTIGDVQMATMKRVIRGWNLTQSRRRPDGGTEEVPIPFSTQNIERLPRRIYRYVLKKYDEMHPEEEESETDFLDGASASSTNHSGQGNLLPMKR